MRRFLFILFALINLAPGPCDLPKPPTVATPNDDGGAGAGGSAAPSGPPGTGAPLRIVTFFQSQLGQFQGALIDGVQVQLAPFNGGGPLAVILDRSGSGNDLSPQCATVVFAPPELHRGASVVLNDEAGDVIVTVYDSLGGILGMISSRQSRAGLQPAGAYLRAPLLVQDATKAIARIDVGTCNGLIHEVQFQ